MNIQVKQRTVGVVILVLVLLGMFSVLFFGSKSKAQENNNSSIDLQIPNVEQTASSNNTVNTETANNSVAGDQIMPDANNAAAVPAIPDANNQVAIPATQPTNDTQATTPTAVAAPAVNAGNAANSVTTIPPANSDDNAAATTNSDTAKSTLPNVNTESDANLAKTENVAPTGSVTTDNIPAQPAAATSKENAQPVNSSEVAKAPESQPKIVSNAKHTKKLATKKTKVIAKTKQLNKKGFVATKDSHYQWAVKVGSFADQMKAQDWIKKLSKNGYRVFVQKHVSSKNSDVTEMLVFVGPEKDQHSAAKIAKNLQQTMHLKTQIARRK